jgi:hypothetical protein
MAAESPPPKLAPARNYSAAEFSIIPEKNVFSQSRSKEEKVEETVSSEPAPLTQKPVLVGVVLSDAQWTATIIEPSGSPQGQKRRAQIKRVGDFYQGYKIASISSDRIVLESGTRKEIIPLHEGSKRARGGKTPILTTRVVPIGAGTAGGGTPVSAASGGTGAARTATPVSVPVAASAGQPAGTQTAVTPARSTPVAVQQQPQEQATQQQAPSAGSTNTQGQRVIRTPFGNIVRPARKERQ